MRTAPCGSAQGPVPGTMARNRHVDEDYDEVRDFSDEPLRDPEATDLPGATFHAHRREIRDWHPPLFHQARAGVLIGNEGVLCVVLGIGHQDHPVRADHDRTLLEVAAQSRGVIEQRPGVHMSSRGAQS